MPGTTYPCTMYFPSKHAIHVLTEDLRKGLVAAKSRIKVTQICPGNVRTDIQTDLKSITGDEWYTTNPYLESEDASDATPHDAATWAAATVHNSLDDMDRWRGRVAIVTGASSGIGAAVAFQLQDAGLTVVALARRADKIPDSMDRWRGRVAVVTGASAGIGAAVAYQLQDAGLTVVALARRADKIPDAVQTARKAAEGRGRASPGKATSPGKLHHIKCDVTKESDILDAFRWVKENVGGVDVLVNSAGVVGEHKLYESPTQEWRNILDLNVLGLSICTREGVQQMRARGVDDGHIIHISSIFSHIMPTGPLSAMLFASKHGVRVLTEGLRKELVAVKSRIKVTQICPGFVTTEILDNLKTISGAELLSSIPCLEPEDVSDATLYALMTPPHVQIHDIVVKPVGETL